MKEIDYRKIKKTLKITYFKPDHESKKRLYKKLQLTHGEYFKEHRFVMGFRFALAGVVTLVCLVNIHSVNPQYLNRYNGKNIIAIGEYIHHSSLVDKLIPKTED